VRAGEEIWLEIAGPARREQSLLKRLRWQWRLARRRILAPTAGLLGFIAALIGIVGALTGGESRPASSRLLPMHGDVNVAVADFTVNGQPSEAGQAFADTTYTVLRRQLAAVDFRLGFEVAHPMGIRVVGLQQSRDRRSLDPTQIAQRLHADIVIFGDMRVSSLGTRFAPQFYLAGRQLLNAVELTGTYSYGRAITTPFSPDSNPQTRAQLRAAVAGRAEELVTSFVAVGYYARHDARQAATYF